MITYLDMLKEADNLLSIQLRSLTEEGRPYVAYLYGGDGRVITESYVRQLAAIYPAHYQGLDIEALIRHAKGAHALDCSQLIVGLSDAPSDMSSGTLIARCEYKTTPAEGVEGSLLWKPGHVALDIGKGYCLEMVTEFRDLQVNKISGRGFTRSGRLPWVDYTGASSK